MIVGNTIWVDLAKVVRKELLPENQRDFQTIQQVNGAWKTSLDITSFANTNPQGNSEEGIILQSVKDLFDQAFSAMIYAKSDGEVESTLNKMNIYSFLVVGRVY
ncbi:hypothetical protein PMSD_09380 [Paenibacillus macquariensis subsp. defensor]|nr:hypothetical protein PMSD_09380 [Paenibacillus macquariensis subsp. defensor]